MASNRLRAPSTVSKLFAVSVFATTFAPTPAQAQSPPPEEACAAFPAALSARLSAHLRRDATAMTEILRVNCALFEAEDFQDPQSFDPLSARIDLIFKDRKAWELLIRHPEAFMLVLGQKDPVKAARRLQAPRRAGADAREMAHRQNLLLSVLAMENRPEVLAQMMAALDEEYIREAVIALADQDLFVYAALFFYERTYPTSEAIYDRWLAGAILGGDAATRDRALGVALEHGVQIRRLLVADAQFRAAFPSLTLELPLFLHDPDPEIAAGLFDAFLETPNVWLMLNEPDGREILRRWPAMTADLLHGSGAYPPEGRALLRAALRGGDELLGVLAIGLKEDENFRAIISLQGMGLQDLDCVAQKILRDDPEAQTLRQAIDAATLERFAGWSADLIRKECRPSHTLLNDILVVDPIIRLSESLIDGRGFKPDVLKELVLEALEAYEICTIAAVCPPIPTPLAAVRGVPLMARGLRRASAPLARTLKATAETAGLGRRLKQAILSEQALAASLKTGGGRNLTQPLQALARTGGQAPSGIAQGFEFWSAYGLAVVRRQTLADVQLLVDDPLLLFDNLSSHDVISAVAGAGRPPAASPEAAKARFMENWRRHLGLWWGSGTLRSLGEPAQSARTQETDDAR